MPAVGGAGSDCWVGTAVGGEAKWKVPMASTSIGVDLSLGAANAVELDWARAQGDQKMPSFDQAWF